MICRLCLEKIKLENRVPLFNESESDETRPVKLIAKYLQLEITPNDTISSAICLECHNHLDEFHEFCLHVEKKQSTLQNEFLEGKDVYESDEDEIAVDNECLLDHEEFEFESIKVEEGINLGRRADVEDVFDISDQESEALHEEFVLTTMEETEEQDIDDDDPDDGDDDDDIDGEEKQGTTDDDMPLSQRPKSKKEVNVEDEDEDEDDGDDDDGYNDDDDNDDDDDIDDDDDMPLSQERDDPTWVSDQQPHDENNKHPSKAKDKFIAKHMQLKCDLCKREKIFKKFLELRRHFEEYHSSVKPYVKCCDRRIIHRSDLYNHVQWHVYPEQYKCAECGKIYHQKDSLNNHIMKIHTKTAVFNIECAFCDKKFMTKGELKHHRKYHHTEKSFKCKYCDKGFVYQRYLDRHINLTHYNIYPYKCDICGKKWKHKAYFDIHMDDHKGVPAKKCHICGAFLKTVKTLRAHIKNCHEDETVWNCQYCDRVFKRKESLASHETNHTGFCLHTCPHCLRDFRSRSNMYVHVKKHHPQEWLEAKSGGADSKNDNVKNRIVEKILFVKKKSADQFPITTEENLKEVDEKITKENHIKYVKKIKYLLYGDLSLKNVLHNDIIIAYNIDGTHGMKALTAFPNFYSALIAAIEALPAAAEIGAVGFLKKAFRLRKKRCHKRKRRERLKEKEDYVEKIEILNIW